MKKVTQIHLTYFSAAAAIAAAESWHCWASPGWLPWFQPEVHALAGGADPGRAGEEQPGDSAEVCLYLLDVDFKT